MDTEFQLLLFAMARGVIYSVYAIGFVAYYRVTRRFDMLFAAYFCIGGYGFAWRQELFSINAFFSLIIMLLIVMAIAYSVEWLIYQPIEKWSGRTELSLIASMGLYFVVENCVALIFGDNSYTAFAQVKTGRFLEIPGVASVSQSTIFVIVVGSFAFLGLKFLSENTRWGLLARAAGENHRLFMLHGHSTKTTYYMVSLIAALVASIAGTLHAVDLDLKPTMGIKAMVVGVLIALAVVRMRTGWAVLGFGMLLSFLEHLFEYRLGPRWAELVVYTVFIPALLIARFSRHQKELRRQ